MRRALTGDLAPPRWPSGVHVGLLSASEARRAHELLVLGYAAGGGSVDAYPLWWSSLTADPEYDPSLRFVAKTHEGEMVAFAQCWTSAFIKDLAVSPHWRRRGLGQALLQHIFAEFRARGAKSVDLKVQADNPSGAARLYERVGMRRAPGREVRAPSGGTEHET